MHFKCLYGLIHFRGNNLNYEQDHTFGVALHNCSNTYSVQSAQMYGIFNVTVCIKVGSVTFTDGLKLHIYKDN